MGTVSEAGVRTAPEPSPGHPASTYAPPIDQPARVVSSRVNIRTRLGDIWRARELFIFLVRRDLKVKYKNSFLGFLWSMVNPAIVLLVYYVVFQYILKAGIPDFALYLFSGLIVWNMFSTALSASTGAIVGSAGIVKKVAFPREILALAQVGTATVFFFFQAVVLVVFLLGFQYAPKWSYLPLVLWGLVDLVVLTSAAAIFLSSVNVYFRDVEHLILVALQAWFWAVPIIYSYNLVYDLFRRHHLLVLAHLYLIDPITPIVLVFQRAFYGKVVVSTPTNHHYIVLSTYPYHFYVAVLAALLAVGFVLFLLSMLVFARIEGNFAQEL
ncbi:MAG TPA: ABC transporter permease [Acidimicrobiales bacterium]|nr:ABC transporter permease [Acidimicrobiales bacterium]